MKDMNIHKSAFLWGDLNQDHSNHSSSKDPRPERIYPFL